MESALLVTVDFSDRHEWPAEERAAELKELAVSAGARVVREEIVRRDAPSPACFIGSGKTEELGRLCVAEGVNLVIFNNDLTGTQQKNLEEAIGVKTVDRTQLILDIFARRARSNEGKLQVELAQLMYLLPRLTGKGVELSRLGGGIGTRGPGEQKLEVDRRRIRSDITRLKKTLSGLQARRAMMRENRQRFSMLTIALVGYTNVGKSTLLNALTNSDVIVRDKLFATLDPTARTLVMPNKQKVLFIDTVGFLRDLPHHLIEAFKATLEEVAQADLLINLVDASHPKAIEQAEEVAGVLKEIGASGKPVITALNKVDKVGEKGLVDKLLGRFENSVAISALKRQGFDELIGKISKHIKPFTQVVTLVIPASDAKTLGLVYNSGLVLKTDYRLDEVFVEAEISPRLKELLRRYIRE